MQKYLVSWLALWVAVSSLSHGAELGLNGIITTDAGGVFGSSTASVPGQWENDFKPKGGTMTINTKQNDGGFWAVGLGLEPTLRIPTQKGEWELGLPIIYRGSLVSGEDTGGWNENLISTKTVDWWDPVTLQSETIRKDWPWIGLSVRYNHWCLAYSITPYDLVVKDYYGIDHYGARNESAVKKESTLRSGISQRVDLAYRFLETKLTLGPYVEFAGNNAVWVGLTLSFSPRLLGK
jgi:hypothetical protein